MVNWKTVVFKGNEIGEAFEMFANLSKDKDLQLVEIKYIDSAFVIFYAEFDKTEKEQKQ